jgi:hypothetical protein
MEPRKYVRPKEGLLIRDEYGLDHIPADGRWVKYTTLVRKHLQAGDLVEDKDATPGAAEEPASAATPRKRERMITTGSEG